MQETIVRSFLICYQSQQESGKERTEAVLGAKDRELQLLKTAQLVGLLIPS